MYISRKKLLKVMGTMIVLFSILAIFLNGQFFNEISTSSISIHDNVPRDPLKFSGPSTARQKAVVKGFLHGWKGYRDHAWGHDELKPFSSSWEDWLHLGSTLVDSLDTIYIMGLTKEFEEARLWVKDNLSFQSNHSVSLFETTIRILGGLLSAYHLSGDELFLDKSVALGKRLLPAFTTPTGIPYSDINLGSGVPKSPHTGKFTNATTTSEATTLQMEFRELSRASGISTFEESAFHVSEIVHKLHKRDVLVPSFINFNTGRFIEKTSFSMAGGADSYYEYLLKQWIQTGRTIDFLREDYEEAIAGAQKLLVRHSKPSNFLIVGELNDKDEYIAKLDHLTCFLPGTLALGVHYGMPKEHMKFAEDLISTCYQNYAIEPTHLAPESTNFNLDENISSDRIITEDSARYTLLRPETVESLWYLYVLTGNTTYQDWGWEIFQAIENGARMDTSGYTSLTNVDPGSGLLDKLESFFFGETLKYLYLLFGDRNDDDHKLLSFDKFVVTTEAHFLPIHSS